MNNKYYQNCCGDCKGKCCKVGGLYITKEEYNNIDNEFQKLLHPYHSGYITKLGEKCPFLKDNGCELGENRFLECKLYPYEILDINNIILKKECPYFENFYSDNYRSKAIQLLKEYKEKGWITQADIVGINNNPYPDKL